jgi:hypothetical protein
MKVRPINFEDLKAALRQVKASVSSQVHHFYVCVSPVAYPEPDRIRMFLDPDPYVFGSGSVPRTNGSGSGSGAFYHSYQK